MTRTTTVRAFGVFLLFALGVPSLAAAQATRTWVSGVGDDANPCSRTAPCKTFAGAISKTAAGGEINVLDPGGFGAVTITKSISITSEGFEAGVLVSGTNGIIINAASTDNIVLRGLDIEGIGTGLNGIQFLAGGMLTVEKCTINGFTQKAINFVPSTRARLNVIDTEIRNNNNSLTGGGIFVQPGAGVFAIVAIDNVRFLRNNFGVRVEEDTRAVVRNSLVNASTSHAFLALGNSVAPNLSVIDSVASNNGGAGLRSEGIATARVGGSTFVGNVIGLQPVGSGVLISFGTNENSGNGTEGSPTMTVPRQ